ncbi:MAG: hypothetical protein AABY87_06580 [bacterium]
MFGKTGNLSFPFLGISLEKFYVDGDPMFDDKVEEISLSWKEEFERGRKSAIAELLRDVEIHRKLQNGEHKKVLGLKF